jgi:hypothetical protein
MALSFLYLAFVRILQLLRLSRSDSDELAIEVVWVPKMSSALSGEGILVDGLPVDCPVSPT